MRLFRGLFAPADPMNAMARQMGEVELPFEIRPVVSDHELVQVAALRFSGYKMTDVDKVGATISAMDYAPNAVVLGAFHKETAVLLGTMRVVLGSLGPTEIEQLVALPGQWAKGAVAEARLLCVPRGEHAVSVKILLSKAFYQAALHYKTKHMVIASRRALEGYYRLMHFRELSESGVQFTPPGSSISHRILGMKTTEVEDRWRQDPEMKAFVQVFFAQSHPDIFFAHKPSDLNPLCGRPALTDRRVERVIPTVVREFT